MTAEDLCRLHYLIMGHCDPENAGHYANRSRSIFTKDGIYSFPPSKEVPVLVRDFLGWLAQAPNTPETAIAAHNQLVFIHPFNDGNGRTARLVMDMILIRGGHTSSVRVPLSRATRPRVTSIIKTSQ